MDMRETRGRAGEETPRLQLQEEPLFAIHFDSDPEAEDEEEEEDEEELEEEFDYDVVARPSPGSSLASGSKAAAAALLVRDLCAALASFTSRPPKYAGHELKVLFDPIGSAGIHAIGKALTDQYRRYLLLKAHLDSTPVQPDAHTAAAFANASKHLIQSVEFGINGVEAAGPTGASSAAATLRSLKKLLASHRSLASLAIWGNTLTPDSLTPLSRGLGSSTSLTSLSLANTDLTDAGLAVLVEGIKKNRSLERLDLKGNQISDVGASILLSTLASSNHLRALILAENQITDLCCSQLAHWLEMPRFACSLEVVDLGSNLLGDGGLHQLLRALRSNSRLQQLDLRGHEDALVDRAKTLRLAADILRENGHQWPSLVRVVTMVDDEEQPAEVDSEPAADGPPMELSAKTAAPSSSAALPPAGQRAVAPLDSTAPPPVGGSQLSSLAMASHALVGESDLDLEDELALQHVDDLDAELEEIDMNDDQLLGEL